MKPSTLKKLERFNKGIEILEELKRYNKEHFVTDLKTLSIAERNLQVCTEFLIDLSSYILSRLDITIPETYKEIIEKIYDAKIIHDDLKDKLIDIVGLRNIIVHMYADVKAELIFDNLEDIIAILKTSVRKLLEFCKEKSIDP
ncbi:MAG: DUF86 domain-containing protein [Nitrososphaerota archaeon]